MATTNTMYSYPSLNREEKNKLLSLKLGGDIFSYLLLYFHKLFLSIS